MTKEEKIKKFKESIDYRDICYMIDHIESEDIMLSCLDRLGYKTGINIVLGSESFSKPKSVMIGMRGEFRVQVSECKDSFAVCVIQETNN